MSTTLRVITTGIVLALALAACGDDAGDMTVEEPADTPTDDPADTQTEEPAPDESEGAVVSVAATDAGDVLVDEEGMTLYVFEPDEQGESTCYDDCAATWPPLVTESDPEAGEGADAALLGTAERTDGTMQVTYDGWPLYSFGGDEAPGDTNGQGVNDVWWMASPSGEPLRE